MGGGQGPGDGGFLGAKKNDPEITFRVLVPVDDEVRPEPQKRRSLNQADLSKRRK